MFIELAGHAPRPYWTFLYLDYPGRCMRECEPHTRAYIDPDNLPINITRQTSTGSVPSHTYLKSKARLALWVALLAKLGRAKPG